MSAEKKLGRIPVGISSGRRDTLLETTRARLANLGVPIFHIILREPGNYDTDGKFKTKWAQRLASNYELVEFFDRDAVVRLNDHEEPKRAQDERCGIGSLLLEDFSLCILQRKPVESERKY